MTRSVGLGRQHGELRNSNSHGQIGTLTRGELETTSRDLDQLNWGINRVKTTPQDNIGRTNPNRCGKPPSPALEVAAKMKSKAKGENKGNKQSCTEQPIAMRDPMPQCRCNSTHRPTEWNHLLKIIDLALVMRGVTGCNFWEMMPHVNGGPYVNGNANIDVKFSFQLRLFTCE